ncbi:MAG: hypothetical protein ACLS6G_14505 [Christensenellales bacterium]
MIRACGRVDHGDAFMDDDPMERARHHDFHRTGDAFVAGFAASRFSSR